MFFFLIRMLLIIRISVMWTVRECLQICGDISTYRPVFISYIKKKCYIVDKLEHMW